MNFRRIRTFPANSSCDAIATERKEKRRAFPPTTDAFPLFPRLRAAQIGMQIEKESFSPYPISPLNKE